MKNATTPKCTTPWKVTPRRSNEPLFGPMSPPPSGVVLPQQSPCSARSDLSSTSSIMGKSGEWTVSNKMDNTPGPMLPERQHAGWQVKINSMTNNEDLKEEETKGTSSEVEERNQRNNKKHKKEKRKKKEKKENVKGKYQKLDESQSEWVDKEELKKEKRKRNKSDKKKKKKKKWNKQRASDDERKSLLIEDSTKKKRKNKGDGDAEQAKRCRLVDYSDGSSSEGHQESEGNSSDVKKNDLNSDVVHPKRSTPGIAAGSLITFRIFLDHSVLRACHVICHPGTCHLSSGNMSFDIREHVIRHPGTCHLTTCSWMSNDTFPDDK